MRSHREESVESHDIDDGQAPKWHFSPWVENRADDTECAEKSAAVVGVPTHPHLGLLSLAFLSSDKFESGSLPRIQPLAVTCDLL